MDILEKLFYGKLDPGARNAERGEEQAELLGRMAQNEELLLAGLSGEQKRMLTEFSRDSDEMGMLSELTGFQNGFCLGVRLMMEAVCRKLPGETE